MHLKFFTLFNGRLWKCFNEQECITVVGKQRRRMGILLFYFVREFCLLGLWTLIHKNKNVLISQATNRWQSSSIALSSATPAPAKQPSPSCTGSCSSTSTSSPTGTWSSLPAAISLDRWSASRNKRPKTSSRRPKERSWSLTKPTFSMMDYTESRYKTSYWNVDLLGVWKFF